MSERAKNAIGLSVPDRWMAEVIYRTERKPENFVFEELEDLDELIERGPDWNEIDRIVIVLNRPTLLPKKETP